MLHAQNASAAAANERLRILLEDKDAKIAELEGELARLERLISRNSGNSSMPPSTDDLPGKTPPSASRGRGGGAQARQAARRAGCVPGLERPPGPRARMCSRTGLRVRHGPGQGG